MLIRSRLTLYQLLDGRLSSGVLYCKVVGFMLPTGPAISYRQAPCKGSAMAVPIQFSKTERALAALVTLRNFDRFAVSVSEWRRVREAVDT